MSGQADDHSTGSAEMGNRRLAVIAQHGRMMNIMAEEWT